jgi:hypothetical protein
MGALLVVVVMFDSQHEPSFSGIDMCEREHLLT